MKLVGWAQQNLTSINSGKNKPYNTGWMVLWPFDPVKRRSSVESTHSTALLWPSAIWTHCREPPRLLFDTGTGLITPLMYVKKPTISSFLHQILCIEKKIVKSLSSIHTLQQIQCHKVLSPFLISKIKQNLRIWNITAYLSPSFI